MKIDVIIPTYKPDEGFIKLLQKLCEQTISVNRVIVMNTEEKYYPTNGIPSDITSKLNIVVNHIKKEDFDHGNTRHEAMLLSDAQICVFMTQDALPVDDNVIEELIKPFDREDVAVSYGRQLAYDNSSFVEKLTREFNYPDKDCIKGIEDLDRLQIKTYFCSNVCSAYRRETYIAIDGFVRRTIFNEDMLFAAKAQKAGYKIAYCSGAKVYHSHNYNGRQQFKRNFDNGVSHAQYPAVFEGISSNGEGMRMVKDVIGKLVKSGHVLLIPGFVWNTGCKLLGFKLGCRYNKLPKWMVMACTSDKSYFEKTGNR